MRKYILLIVSLFLVILSCQKDEEPSLFIKDTTIDLSDAGGSQTISFVSNMNWTAKSSQNWCTISQTSGGASTKSILVTATANDTFDARSCTITFSVQGLTNTVKVYQSQEDAIVLSSKTSNVSSESQPLEVKLKTNVDFEVVIPAANKSWISYTGTRALRSETLLFTIAANEDYIARSTEIFIKNKATSLQDILTITQEGAPIATPIINPFGGTYSTAQTVTITCATEEAEIRYTLDGSDPIETSPLYIGEITIDTGVTIKAKAFIENKNSSAIATETFIIITPETEIIVGSSDIIQHIDASKDFVFQLNDLKDKEVFFVFSNTNENSSVALPLLQSDVVTTTRANRSTSFSEPATFLVSGKPSISKFNNGVWKESLNSTIKPLRQQNVASYTKNISIGSSEDFYDHTGNAIKSTVRKVISAHGKNLYMWVADDCWGAGSKKQHHVTQQMIDAFAPKFLSPSDKNDIYEWVVNFAGEPWGPTPYDDLISETDNIHIWLMDIDDDNMTTGPLTLGYYYARDNYLKSSFSDSNEKLLFTIDAVLFGKTTNGSWNLTDFWPQEMISTLAHEFTHMIYFYQHSILTGLDANTAINEMSAQCVEDLVANKILANGPRGVPYATSSAGNSGNRQGRLPLYNTHRDYNFLDWSSNDDEALINYSKTYALGAYLMRNYGGANFIRELIQNNSTDSQSIVDAVNVNGGGVQNYGDVLQRFGAASLLSDKTEMAAGYRYNTANWSSSTINGISYDLGAINLYNYAPQPNIHNILPVTQKPGSNILYRAGSYLNGRKEWYFKGMSNDTKLTVVVK